MPFIMLSQTILLSLKGSNTTELSNYISISTVSSQNYIQ